MRIGLLPASGTASRMRGLPKFLLPVSENVETLLEAHIRMMLEVVDRVLLPIRTENIEIVRRLSLRDSVELIPLATSTMSETVSKVLSKVKYDTCTLGMPDTYFTNERVEVNPYLGLSNMNDEVARLGVWPTNPSQRGQVGSVKLDANNFVLRCEDKSEEFNFGYHWGVLSFKSEALQYLDPTTPHVGYLINPVLAAGHKIIAKKIEGHYFDCGTFREYQRCLSQT